MSSHDDQYGFRWGQVHVQRVMEYRGRKVISVAGDGIRVEVVVSPKGKNMQVWAIDKNGARNMVAADG